MNDAQPSTAASPAVPPTPITRARDARVVALTLLTGATDAVAFLALGGVFTSVMTGNLVLFGLGIGVADRVTIGHAALAIAAYILGTTVGSRLAGAPAPADRVWPRRVSLALCAEWALFAVVAALWWAQGSRPHGAVVLVSLALAAVALGIQSGAVLRLNVSGLSTTYLTGTLTQVVHSLVTTRRLRGSGRSLCILAALIAGAAVGAVLDTHADVVVPLVSLLVLGAVIVSAELSGRRDGTEAALP